MRISQRSRAETAHAPGSRSVLSRVRTGGPTGTVDAKDVAKRRTHGPRQATTRDDGPRDEPHAPLAPGRPARHCARGGGSRRPRECSRRAGRARLDGHGWWLAISRPQSLGTARPGRERLQPCRACLSCGRTPSPEAKCHEPFFGGRGHPRTVGLSRRPVLEEAAPGGAPILLSRLGFAPPDRCLRLAKDRPD